MEAVAWSLFGLMGASMGVMLIAYLRLPARIEEVRREVHEVRTDLGGRIDAQTSRIDAQTSRIDALNSRMDAHVHPHAG
jgi:hypothetical protein